MNAKYIGIFFAGFGTGGLATLAVLILLGEYLGL